MNDPIQEKLRSSLDEQVEAFLVKGGEITQIATGTSGIAADYKKAPWSKPQDKKPPTKV
ncbi:hypothetical protein IB234_08755 [Pseudomonas sp. PDM16]|uniref:hypothetical protein n=1 Tax=Pseudomonas sp. PDM16 TaxID=2769292 RepID=UPI001786DEDA|nr:hypothetical protein [Pseudomonas sp. PDM16]MBD9414652.1 hypothetical protein [Pseudomonas sp. PDM16]